MTNENILNNGGNVSDEEFAEINETVFEETKPQAVVLSTEEFNQRFIEMFDMFGDIWDMPEFKINHEKTLEVAGAKLTAGKLYNLAQKYPLMHFLIEPSGGWFGDFWLIGVFCWSKADIVSRKVSGLTLAGKIRNFFQKTRGKMQETSLFKRLFHKTDAKVKK
ncbi:MAG: hypothetical protein J6J35_01415 [Alphaproteobacteria bacterium]|nr:hypothetical protein [Alphaproteobacteria bacterium]